MLTKQDLQQIREVVRGEARVVVREETRTIVKEELVPIKKDIKSVNKKINKLNKKQEEILGFLNREDMELKVRVEKIEDHVGLSSR